MLNTDNKNFKMLALAFSALIVGVEAQAACTSTSPQCCWVVRSWQLMGQSVPTGISSTDNSCCTAPMNGVTCDSTNKVTRIAWSNKTLTGSIPAEIGNMGDLTFLNLQSNQLSGSIPAEIGNLVNLKGLFLSYNQLSGSIPASIGKLINLESLSLSDNQFSGSIPAQIGNLGNLRNLGLSYNQLSGSIPAEIGNLGNLRNLGLYRNQLSGSIPSEIGNLVYLTDFMFFGNQFSGSVPASIGNLIKLTEIYNKLTSIPSSIGNLAKLRYLYISNNKLTSIPSSIGNLSKLAGLNFGFNQLNSIPSDIGSLLNLQSLTLSNNILTSIPSSIGSLSTLKSLTVDNNPVSGTFTPNCNTRVTATNTSLTLCGCATSGSPAAFFPPAGTSLQCLSTGPATPLTKRIQVFSQNIGSLKFTCNNDPNGNPYQDCLNAQAAICNTTYILGNSTRIFNCKNGVDSMTRSLSSYWQEVRKSCGQWSFDGAVKGSSISLACANANIKLQQNAFYLLPDGIRIPISFALTDSVTAGLWSKIN